MKIKKKMNVNFKVLWFEDEMGWRPSSERSMKRIIESHNLVPIITWKKGDEVESVLDIGRTTG